ncbi:sodium channel and clathrin linker 1 [Rattus norvegicus]|uniref:Sodium channel and clathrin linker 1 n=2 Tax=Rattus norvegicus TaxID=10116 RepID=SCLT1_RAT|nr:sodium channel and clathrin linker 1 [Rattus norvegicus]Q8CJ99.1 RecName: Full=Sodium channel and clathrin linker 1; AltName: Full=Clathrin-associated protein 1A; Short=CAP-1A; AltName: Full=Sodium channel Nav1.8-binding protein; AltName: Full=Sodium channel-associated protein 1 [Rattus norvegicus]AAN32724.1 sodium channel associated protein 1A [Rattus norvegicus]|eukprot:NP_714962.1 sodium channel and clathrin linker 1 [Rattus norvegicus]
MATEIDLLRDQNVKLNDILRQHQIEHIFRDPAMQNSMSKGGRGDTLTNSVNDQSALPPLIAEYEKHLEELNRQLTYYQKHMGEMKLQLETVITENERLHSKLKDAVEKQLEALPFGTGIGNDICADDETVRNLQEQLQIANQEKNWAVQLWQTASQELESVQKLYQEHMTEAQIHVFENRKQKDQLNNFQQLTKKLHVANENIEMTNHHFLKTVTEQNMEIEKLRKQLRQAKLDLRVAVTKVEELTKVTEGLQEQMLKKEEDIMSAQGKEEASDRRVQQLQSSIKQLESRLCIAIQEANVLKTGKTQLEKQIKELQAKCSESENEKYEAISRARDSMQLLEEANIKQNQILLEEKQKEVEREKMKKTISHLIQDAAIKARKEVESTKKQYEVLILQLKEELSALQMDCDEKQGQIDRAIRGKRAVEEELEKIYREGKQDEGDYRKLEEMHQRCLAAERSKDDLQLRLKTAENRIKQLEINSSEEISRSHEMIQKLQTVLESERENCGFVSEQRLKLQQENEQLQKETEDLRKVALEAQKKAKLKVSTMEHQFSIKEHGFEVQLREMEDSNRNSIVELRHLLAAQQKTANRWKEETKKLTESAEMRISSLKSELSRQKLHTQELLSQLEMANEKVAENEKLILEHQEKANRLQRRLSQAEERAASASQQLSVITVQRRKAASMMNLENI